MTTNNFINDCMKCINVCKREFFDEFTEWIEKLILTEVAGASENMDCITDTKPTTKELSIANIKKELLDAFLADMRIINSFADKNVEKTTDYIRKNVFDYLDEIPSCSCADTYISFDVAQRKNDYEVYVVIKMHKDILDKDGENRLDSLANTVEDIVKKSYPYMTRYQNNPKMCANHYAERHIYFSLEEFEKSCYESSKEPLV